MSRPYSEFQWISYLRFNEIFISNDGTETFSRNVSQEKLVCTATIRQSIQVESQPIPDVSEKDRKVSQNDEHFLLLTSS